MNNFKLKIIKSQFKASKADVARADLAASVVAVQTSSVRAGGRLHDTQQIARALSTLQNNYVTTATNCAISTITRCYLFD